MHHRFVSENTRLSIKIWKTFIYRPILDSRYSTTGTRVWCLTTVSFKSLRRCFFLSLVLICLKQQSETRLRVSLFFLNTMPWPFQFKYQLNALIKKQKNYSLLRIIYTSKNVNRHVNWNTKYYTKNKINWKICATLELRNFLNAEVGLHCVFFLYFFSIFYWLGVK